MSTPAGETAPTLRFADLGLPPAVMAAWMGDGDS